MIVLQKLQVIKNNKLIVIKMKSNKIKLKLMKMQINKQFLLMMNKINKIKLI